MTVMRCLIETVRRQGEIPDIRDIETARLSLGRGAGQDIRLQSRLAGVNHAVIEQRSEGGLRIRAIAPNRILYNGSKLSESMMVPGDEFSIGKACFTVREAPEAYNLRLEIKEPAGRLGKELEDALLANVNHDSGRNGYSMRRAAWALTLAIIILFFLTPLAGFVYKPFGVWLRTVPVLSEPQLEFRAHLISPQLLATDCNRCHEQAFVSVRDAVCTDCHKNTPITSPKDWESRCPRFQSLCNMSQGARYVPQSGFNSPR